MRWSLVAVRLSIIVVTLIAVAIILLSTIPLATGGLKLDLPDNEQDIWDMQGQTVMAELPIGIYNGGYFAIEDFSFWMNLTDNDGYPLVDSWTDPVDLKAGEWTEVVVSLSFDLGDLPPEKQFEIVFNGTEAYLGIGLDAYFGLKTMQVTINIDADESTIEIPPMITEMNIDQTQLEMMQTGTGYDLVLPYSFSASDMIAGEQLTLFMSISNQTELIGEDTEQITLQRNNQGQLTIPLSQDMYEHLLSETDTLDIDTVVTFLGIAMERHFTYQWSPFVSNLQVQGVNGYYTGTDGQIEVYYGFDAAQQIQGTYVNVIMTITDGLGQVAQGTNYFYLQGVNYGTAYLFVPSDVMSRIYGAPADWTITFEVQGTGVNTTMSTTYHWDGYGGGA